MLALEKKLTMNFLIAGNTKSGCDGAFGHVKLSSRRADVVVEKDTMTFISNSAVSNLCGPGSEVVLYN